MKIRTMMMWSLALVAGAWLAGAGEARSDEPVQYDAELAVELGADEYGMRRYVIAFLKRGPNQSHDAETAAALQRGHMDTILRLVEAGKLVVAGPFLDRESPMRGIYIFAVDSVEEARELTATDPAIQAGRLEMELLPWYSSAALMQVPGISARIARAAP